MALIFGKELESKPLPGKVDLGSNHQSAAFVELCRTCMWFFTPQNHKRIPRVNIPVHLRLSSLNGLTSMPSLLALLSVQFPVSS